jgi:hypothetical protein
MLGLTIDFIDLGENRDFLLQKELKGCRMWKLDEEVVCGNGTKDKKYEP